MPLTTEIGVRSLGDLPEEAIMMVAGVAKVLAGPPAGLLHGGVEWVIATSGATSEVVTDWIAQYSDNPDEVRVFCQSNKVMHEARFAAETARNIFPQGSRVRLEIENDPESNGKWVLVSVTVPPESDPLPKYRRFVEVWTAKVAPRASDLIHLAFFFA